MTEARRSTLGPVTLAGRFVELQPLRESHRIRPDGTYRNTATYSIIDSEWPAIKATLERRLASSV